MADEQPTDTTKTEDSDGEKKKKPILYIVLGIIVVVSIILLLIGVFGSSDSDEDAFTSALRIINVQPASPSPAPTSIPTTGSSIISGTISFAGVPVSGSTVAIGQKHVSSSSWEPVVTGLPPRDGVPWSWTQAAEGGGYEIQAFNVSSNGTILFQSPVSSVTAPSSTADLTILISDLPAPPDGSHSVECVDKSSSTNKWRSTVTYNIDNPTSSALQYRLGIGTSREGDLVLDTIVRPASPDTTQSFTTDYILDEGVTYYSAYAYSDSASGNDFSEASSWIPFECVPGATSTPTTGPTSTDTPTTTPAP